MKFINEEAASIHGNIRTSSIYTIESGEWKLAGFEVLSSMKDDDPITYVRIISSAPQRSYHSVNSCDRNLVAYYRILGDTLRLR